MDGAWEQASIVHQIDMFYTSVGQKLHVLLVVVIVLLYIAHELYIGHFFASHSGHYICLRSVHGTCKVSGKCFICKTCSLTGRDWIQCTYVSQGLLSLSMICFYIGEQYCCC